MPECRQSLLVRRRALSEEEAEAVEALNGTAVETMSMSGGEVRRQAGHGHGRVG